MGIMVSIARSVRSSAFVVGCLLLLAVPAWAQEASGIAGVVKDTSGAVLPGVTVEAASPALIEKVRSVVTDGEGRYNIVDLRPGTYTVTFSLAGFRTVRREGIALPTGFTATINGDLPVGSLEETVTVSGAAPLVDTQNVRKQLVASRELLDTLPTSSKHINTLVTLTPGFTGITDVAGRYQFEAGSYHGKRGTKVSLDGMGIENSSGNSSYQVNAATVEEMVLQTGGISAEVNADGPVMNVIPKEGGNTFRTILNGVYSNSHMESDNLTDALRARGLQTGNQTLKIFDESVSVGGPIKQDKIWFFGTFRTWGMARQFAGVFWNKTQHELLSPPGAPLEVVKLTPWVDRPFDRLSSRWEWYDSPAGRVTWQATPKHKFNFFMDHQLACNCGGTSSATLQEVAGGYRFDPNKFVQATWNSPVTSRLLLEAGVGASVSQWNQFWQPGVQAKTIAITDSGLGKSYGASAQYRAHPNFTNRKSQRFSATYVTGSHTMKTGVQIEELFTDNFITANGNVTYSFRNGVPISLTQLTTPYLEQEGARELGVFAQDQWRISRWTFNYGVRFDYFYGFVPTQNLPGTPRPLAKFDDLFSGALRSNAWVGDRSFDAVKSVPSWKDLNPRLGASYDVFGNGRTALKVSVGRYVAKSGTDLVRLLNPITTSVNAASRAWTDTNKNFVPDCDLGNFAANGECAALNNKFFGRNNPAATTWSDAVLKGWGKRDYNWEMSTEIQHELTHTLSLTAGFYRNTGGYFRNADSKQWVTDNILVGPADYDTYCITAPSDPRLPGGGGYQVCGLADIKPAKFGQVENVVKPTEDFGTDKRVNNFISVGLNARLPGGARVGGGLDTGRSSVDQCFAVDAPGLTSYSISLFGQTSFWGSTTIDGKPICHVVTPFKAQTQLKLNGSFPLPKGFVASGIYQDMAGIPIFAINAATTAEIAPSLGRNLAGGARTATVPLIFPQTLFEGRTRRLDLRLTKNLQVTPRVRLQANLDAYNALNSSAVQAINTTFGANFLTPATILDPRILQVSFQLTF